MGLSFLQEAHSSSDLTTYTFAAQNLGVVSSDRYIIVAMGGRKAGASTTISSVSVQGITATIVVQRTNNITNTDVSGLAIVAVPTGATGDVVITFGAGMVRCGIALWAATGLTSATPNDTQSSIANAPTANLNIPAGGFGLACAFDGAQGACTWTGLTEQYDVTIIDSANVQWTGSSDTFVTQQTGLAITATFAGSPTECTGCFASWGIGSVVTTTSNDFIYLGRRRPNIRAHNGIVHLKEVKLCQLVHQEAALALKIKPFKCLRYLATLITSNLEFWNFRKSGKKQKQPQRRLKQIVI